MHKLGQIMHGFMQDYARLYALRPRIDAALKLVLCIIMQAALSIMHFMHLCTALGGCINA